MAHRVTRAGHDLGNHTLHHYPMRDLPRRARPRRGRGLRPGAAAHRPESRDLVPRLRHPGHDRRRSAGPLPGPATTAASSYDVDGLDWQDPSADTVVRAVLDDARGGSIISLHLGHPVTVAALPAILARAARPQPPAGDAHGAARMRLAARLTVPPLAACLVLAGCTGSSSAGRWRRAPAGPPADLVVAHPTSGTAVVGDTHRRRAEPAARHAAPQDPADVWAADRPGSLSPAVTGFRDLVYVPNTESNTVTEIDPHTFKVVAHVPRPASSRSTSCRPGTSRRSGSTTTSATP